MLFLEYLLYNTRGKEREGGRGGRGEGGRGREGGGRERGEEEKETAEVIHVAKLMRNDNIGLCVLPHQLML